MNAIKTVGLLTLLTVMVVFVGGLIGGRIGAMIALGIAAVMNMGTYWFSDKLVLARYRAKPVPPGSHPRLDRIVDNLCARAGLPRPKVYILPEQQPNAFATGRNPQNSAVAVTEGLLQVMNDDELEGVVAHELAHVKHRDILIGSIAATLAGAITMLASFARFGALFGGGRDRGGGNIFVVLAVAIVGPLAAMLVQMAVSRSREFAADAGAAEMAGQPYGLASALRKLGQLSGRIPMDASPASAHMFIVTPLSASGFKKMFSTHPPLEERVRRLVGEGTMRG